jgi:hypothetical protein
MTPKISIYLFSVACLIVGLTSTETAAQKIQTRLNQGAILEPQGKIIHGAGQDQAAYLNYWNVMHAQDKPLMYMTYVNLSDVTSDWAEALKASLMLNGKFQIPQIGLSMTVDGTPSAHYEQDVAGGLYDEQIEMFIDGLESLAIPALVRIGYEFNGKGWNGYEPTTYKNAFKRIANRIRARGVEAATVWNFSLDAGAANMNFQDYYPGDDYVDWWAINFFSASHFTDPYAANFVDSANAHKKPVLLGETTPRFVGVLNGQVSWDQWFSPFFTFIHGHPEIKAFCYINWDWSKYSQWSTWGDARLEQNTTVGSHFANEMDSSQYLHASAEQAFRKTLGFSDNIAPATPGNISVSQLAYPLQLNWNAVSDPSGLSHYIVYKHGVLSDYTLKLPYSDKNVAAGDTITYAVSAMDRAGNESQKTTGLHVTMPSSLSKAINGEFDNGKEGWNLSIFSADASATMKIDANSVISGYNSCAVEISEVSGTDWHIELWQWLSIHPGRKYSITFKAKAAASKVITLGVQQASSPYTGYLYKQHTLTTAVQTFTDTVTIHTADQAKLEFFLGGSTIPVWIDAVSVVETSPVATGVVEETEDEFGSISLLNNYPNPFNASTLLCFRVKEPGMVSLKVFDMAGRVLESLVNENKPVGDYTVEWNAAGISEGVYFCKLQYGSYMEVQKLLILK